MPPTLLTPGPVAIPNFVMQAISRQPIPHRSEPFEAFYAHLLGELRYLFQTEGEVCTLIGSGTYGVEILIRSLLTGSDPVMVVQQGKFSQRWGDYSQQLGKEVITLEVGWGEVPETATILEQAQALPSLEAVVLTHCETSTGVLIDLEEIALGLRELHPEVLILVDGITGVGVLPFYQDAWEIDGVVCASQKGLMNPAGLVAVGLSPRAADRLRPSHASDFANLYNYVQMAQKNNYPFTPPVQLLYGLGAALNYVRSESLPVIWNRSHQSASSFRKGLKQLGGELFGAANSDALSPFAFPDRDSKSIQMELKSRFEIDISGGQGPLKGKILRISHMGLADSEAMKMVLEALKKLL